MVDLTKLSTDTLEKLLFTTATLTGKKLDRVKRDMSKIRGSRISQARFDDTVIGAMEAITKELITRKD